MTKKRFELNDFDNDVEMWELLNIQAEVISDLENENEQLKKELDQFYLLIGRGDWSGLVDLIKDDVE